MNNLKIGSFIRECRLNLKMTQKDLAEKLGLTDKAVSKWERGLSLPDIMILEDLANILGVNVLELIQGKRLENKKDSNFTDFIAMMKYSRSSIIILFQKIFRYFASFLIASLCLFFFFTNLKSIFMEIRVVDVSQNKFHYPTDNDYQKYIRDLSFLIREVNFKMNKFYSNQGTFSDEEYNTLKINVDLMKNMLEKGEVDYYLNHKKYTFKKFIQFYSDYKFLTDGNVDEKEIYKILLKKDNTLGDNLIYINENLSDLRKSYFEVFTYLEQPYSYQFRLPYKGYLPNPLTIIHYQYKIYNKILNDVIKVGEIK